MKTGYLIIILAFLLAPYAIAETNNIIPLSDYNVSLIRLIAQPEKYHGRKLLVEGYLHCKFESRKLYYSKEDADYLRSKNAIWVSFSDDLRFTWANNEIPNQFKPEDFDCKHVLLEGYFDKNNHGHLSCASGCLTNITRIVESIRYFDGTQSLHRAEIIRPNHGLESTGAPPAAETPETHP